MCRHVNDAAVKWRADILHTGSQDDLSLPLVDLPLFEHVFVRSRASGQKMDRFHLCFFLGLSKHASTDGSTAQRKSKVSPIEGDLLTFEKNGGKNVSKITFRAVMPMWGTGTSPCLCSKQ